MSAAAKLKRYDEASIRALKGLEPVRERPAMYIGNTDKRGLHHLVWEIIDNSVDEYLNGHADTVRVILHKSGDTITITVSLGPERIKVPGVVGDSRDAGEDALKDAGFDVNVRGGDGKILKQQPGGGDKAKAGSTVTIWTAPSAEPKNDKRKND